MFQEDPQNHQIRAFIAAGIADEVREKIGRLQAKLKRIEAGVKWVRPEAMHLTLRFLGNIWEDQIDLVNEAMAEATQGVLPIKIEVSGWGTFPEEKRPRVIWLGLKKGADELIEVFDKLEPGLVERGFGPADKRFSPHLTLGRVRGGQRLNQALRVMSSEAKASFGEYVVDHITLFRSQLNPAGAIYTALRETPLR